MTPHTDLCRRLRQYFENLRNASMWPPPELLTEAAAALERQAKEIAELRAAIVDVITYWDGGANRTPFLTKHAAVIARAQEEGE